MIAKPDLGHIGPKKNPNNDLNKAVVPKSKLIGWESDIRLSENMNTLITFVCKQMSFPAILYRVFQLQWTPKNDESFLRNPCTCVIILNMREDNIIVGRSAS